jgi:type IV pilus biogenesis protein CpaD/CtpE
MTHNRTKRLAMIAGIAAVGFGLAGCADNPPTTTTTTTQETTTKPVLAAPMTPPAIVTTTHSETEQVQQ